jgi:hypothetical protein
MVDQAREERAARVGRLGVGRLVRGHGRPQRNAATVEGASLRADREGMDSAQFPWRPLGALLVDRGLLSAAELERALSEQRRTGRVLGQILVESGALTGLSLARVLAAQHGVELRPKSGPEPHVDPGATPPRGSDASRESWRPLGKLLVESGFLTEGELDRALAEQLNRPELRLGEILVERGYLSGPALARALAQQHGVDLGPEEELADELETVLTHSSPEEPVYRVCEVSLEPTYQTRSVIYEGPNFLEAADFAAEFVEKAKPDALEIRRADGAVSETVWTYSEGRAAAAAASQEKLVKTFGFDPTLWGHSS